MEIEWKLIGLLCYFLGLTQSKNEDLKEMGDKMAGMASRVIQLYLKEILNCFLNRDFTVRLWAMKVVEAVLTQGLVHPVQIVPYLICLSTDPETVVRDREIQGEKERSVNICFYCRFPTRQTSICKTLRSSIPVSFT